MRRYLCLLACLPGLLILSVFAQSAESVTVSETVSETGIFEPATGGTEEPALTNSVTVNYLPSPAGSEDSVSPALETVEDELSPAEDTVTVLAGGLSREEAAALWRGLPAAGELVYRFQPLTRPPYAIGQLADSYLEDGLAYLNLIRRLAGLSPVTLSDHLCVQAQYGAVLLAANDLLTHSPEKPADMESSFFRMGANACAASNLSMRYGYSPDQLLRSALQGHMNEDSSLNRLDLGHRRWLLNPRLGQVGFGLAASASGKQYIAVPVTDETEPDLFHSAVAWPAAGVFPNQLFAPGTPWSVSLSDSVYRLPAEEELQVTVTRRRDGRQFVPPVLDSQSQLSREGSYLLVSSKPYGSGFCVSFSIGAGELGEDSYWGLYHVRLSGLHTVEGADVALEYDVWFIDGEASSAPSPWAEEEVGAALALDLVPEELQERYDQPITRLEYARLVMQMLRRKLDMDNQELEELYAVPDPTVFFDCDDPDALAAGAVGAVKGVGSGWFLPGGLITRQDAAVLLCRTAGLFLSEPEPPASPEFSDARAISGYALSSVLWACGACDGVSGKPVLAGTGNGRFSPRESLTREQAILAVLRLYRADLSPEPEPSPEESEYLPYLPEPPELSPSDGTETP